MPTDAPGCWPGVCIRVMFVVPPGWFVALEWAITIALVVLATVWCFQRYRQRKEAKHVP